MRTDNVFGIRHYRKRLITERFLKLYHFKLVDEKSNLWYGRCSYPDQYKYETLRYDFNNRILYTVGCRTVGCDDGYSLSEEEAYKWIKSIRGFLLN